MRLIKRLSLLLKGLVSHLNLWSCRMNSDYRVAPAVFDGSGTTTNDKINDNLFFSCCCGQGGRYGWLQVCDCQTSAFRCNSTCVVQALRHKNRYYYAAQEIYRNVSAIFPDSDFWIAGYSLGGSTGSLLALTYGLPVVTFEA